MDSTDARMDTMPNRVMMLMTVSLRACSISCWCEGQDVQLVADVADGGGNVIDLQQIGIDPLDVVPARNACGRHRTERLKIQHQFLQLFDLIFFRWVISSVKRRQVYFSYSDSITMGSPSSA